ncbi:MAG: NnrU family protein [Ascidiaceihabitans sp.]|nr:NnrU family protein [Ascidiaceihabitans sp.]
MLLIIIGLILWTGAHYWKRLAPAHRAGFGDKGKLVVTIASFAAIALMVIGYRSAEFIPVWNPPSFFQHINNLMMLGAFFLIGMSATTGRLRGKMRHPMLLGVKVWAVAHLLVNGDVASIILFGGMLVWAVGSVILINRSVPVWDRPAPGAASKDILLIVITLVTFAIAAGIHIALGVNPFG